MTREKPNSGFSNRIRTRNDPYPDGYVSLPKPSSFTAATSPQVESSTSSVQRSSSQPSNTEDDKTATPAVATKHKPSTDAIKRKRALTDEDGIPTVSVPSRIAEATRRKHTINSASSKRREGSKIASAGLIGLDVPDDVETSLQTVAAHTPSTNANEQDKKVEPPQAKRAKVTLPTSESDSIRTIRTNLKAKRRIILQKQIKPVKRLLARPRFLRQAKDDHRSRDPSTATVVRKYESFLDILEPGLPGLKSAVAASKDLLSDADDAEIAQGLSRDAPEDDPEEGSKQMEEPEDDKNRSKTAKQLTKWENTLLVNDGLNTALPPINTLPDIFSDMVEGGWNDKEHRHLEDSVEHVRGTELRVGTACSGTECPILALELLKDGKFSQK